jgi:hypothetical protein
MVYRISNILVTQSVEWDAVKYLTQLNQDVPPKKSADFQPITLRHHSQDTTLMQQSEAWESET